MPLPPQELPLYKEELEVYFSPGKSMGVSPGLGQLRGHGLNLCPLFCSGICPSSPGFPLPPTRPPLLSPRNPPGHFARGSDRHMVRLEDVFQRFPRMPMSVEVKEENEKLIHKVVLWARWGGPAWEEA